MEEREIAVPPESEGARVDRFVADALGVSRGYVRRLLHRGVVRLGDGAAIKGGLLRAGDRIVVRAFRHPNEGPPANPALALPLVAESEAFLAFAKPAGMPSLPLDFEEAGTAVNAALAQFPALAAVGERGLEGGLVHRLDTGTSGVLLFARTDAAWQRARAAFRERRVDKRYLALVHGHLAEGSSGELRLRLSGRSARVRVTAGGGHETVTRIERVHPRGDHTLVELGLVTGYRHQLRATLAHLGHPIVGDRLYGSRADETRYWLHAHTLAMDGFRARAEPPERLAV